jgi:hypothetical protein
MTGGCTRVARYLLKYVQAIIGRSLRSLLRAGTATAPTCALRITFSNLIGHWS